MESVHCNLCGADNYTEYLTRGDLNLFTKGTFRLVRCLECGLVYLNPRPSAKEIQSYYLDDYDQYSVAVRDEKSTLVRLARRYGLRKRIRAILHYKSKGRLLDVGCATGDFLAEMHKVRGWDVYGVEPSPVASQYARQHLGVSVRTGLFDEVGFTEGSFDVITMWNVLEHLSDPFHSLSTINRLLASNGLLVVSTPILDSLDARMFGPYWIGYEIPRHLYIFSTETLKAMFRRAGFKIIASQCLYGGYAASASSFRFWLRARALGACWRETLENVLFAYPLRFLFAPYFFVRDRWFHACSIPSFFALKVAS